MKKIIKRMINRYNNFIRDIKIGQSNKLSDKKVRYLVNDTVWSTRHDGECLMKFLPNQIGKITTSHHGIKHGILHIGGVTNALYRKKIRWPSKEAQCGLTWFHVLDNDKRLALVPKLDKGLAFWHTSCSSTAEILIRNGASKDKMHIIPLGVDIDIFKPIPNEEKVKFRKKIGIPDDAFVIGSFQKDSYGWDDGERPKLEKGPDIFCDVIEKLNESYNIFVLLSGPARGYVKNRLLKSEVKFYHTGYLDYADDVAPFYNALDLYLIASRIEGGPKAALEAPSSGIPLVTSSVGMVPDLFTHNETALISNNGDKESLHNLCEKIINDPALRNKLSIYGRKLAEKNSWSKISKRYYDELYQPIINNKKNS
ncbi:glycosyltransferase family 4 protein [Amphritea sp. 2_MG-2023]|uniref:glycosyltransferase family 4 protein n=1 Tax=Amphritea TaxID=515417 RepID=UPI001C0754CE|nr:MULTISPECIES: glycosyltransferase family 4 protein [Amphritea]MBU2965628.1 glycosyltransferase family 4 protein [Amphritea atlantica]MDO6417184.1 glycosyltransferase family 4 protein [Amphritea sp. 2_MG-2023]